MQVKQAADDFVTQVRLRAGRAKLLAQRGAPAEAEEAAREAVALAGKTEYIDIRGDALLALGEVLHAAGRPGDAADAMRAALTLWEAKGNVAFAARTRRLVAGASTTPLQGVDSSFPRGGGVRER